MGSRKSGNGNGRGNSSSYEYSFKILLVGDSGVGKSSLLLSFISQQFPQDLSPTIDILNVYMTDSASVNPLGMRLCYGLLLNDEELTSLVYDDRAGRILEIRIALLEVIISEAQRLKDGELDVTICVDFKIRLLTVGGKSLKLTIWDTAGQERFGSLTSSYYRGAHGIMLVYDVTKRETFTNLSDVWAKEVEYYSTDPDCIKIVVGNKMDRDSERNVTREEGAAFALKHGCLFYECSAKTRENVQRCFKELILKILEVPSLLDKGSTVVKNQILKQKQLCEAREHGNCCT